LGKRFFRRSSMIFVESFHASLFDILRDTIEHCYQIIATTWLL